jgi:hypothetical protein
VAAEVENPPDLGSFAGVVEDRSFLDHDGHSTDATLILRQTHCGLHNRKSHDGYQIRCVGQRDPVPQVRGTVVVAALTVDVVGLVVACYCYTHFSVGRLE